MSETNAELGVDTLLRAPRSPWTRADAADEAYVLPPGEGPPVLLGPPALLVWQCAEDVTSARRIAAHLVDSGTVVLDGDATIDSFADLVLGQLRGLEAAGLVDRMPPDA